MHIDNLYKNPDILFCYALEKIHGTSAHIAFKREQGVVKKKAKIEEKINGLLAKLGG